MDYENIGIETVGERAGIVLILMKYGKDRRNILRKVFLEELNDAIGSVQNLYRPKVIILSGGGRVFSLGADLSEFGDMARSDLVEFSIMGQGLMQSIREIEPIVIAAINGMALGGGFELALACDIRWAHSRAVFAFPECLRGLIPAWGGTLMAKYHMPPSLAGEFLMTGTNLGAQNALKYGIVSRIFEGRNFHQEIITAAAGFIKIDHDILSGLKQLMNRDLSPSEHLRMENDVFAAAGEKRARR